MIGTIIEKIPGIRYRKAQIAAMAYRKAFGALGEGSVIIRPLMLQGVKGLYLGARNLVREDAWLASEGKGKLRIGSNNYFGHRLHVHAIDDVAIGSECVIADNVFISSTDHGRIDRHAVHGTGPITIGDHVFIGQNAVILGGVTIGDHATVGAGAVVTKDVEPGATVAGVPARVIS